MSLPPLNLLLPHRYTFRDSFEDFPLHLSSHSSAPLLAILLSYHAANRPADSLLDRSRSLLLNCYPSKEEFSETLVHPQAPLSAFFRGDATAKGKYLYAASRIDIIHIGSLHELRALLYILYSEPQTVSVTETDDHDRLDVPDSQDSQQDDGGSQRSPAVVPILAISGFDLLHQAAGEYSAQGYAQTLASAIDASSKGCNTYRLIVQDVDPVTTEIDVFKSPHAVPADVAGSRTTVEAVLARHVKVDWHLNDGDDKSAVWSYLSRKRGGKLPRVGYRIDWEETQDGECENARLTSLATVGRSSQS